MRRIFRMLSAVLKSVHVNMCTMAIDEVVTIEGRSSVCPTTCISRPGMSKAEEIPGAVIRTSSNLRSSTKNVRERAAFINEMRSLTCCGVSLLRIHTGSWMRKTCG